MGDVNTVVVEAVLVLGTDEVIVVVLELESGMVDTVVLLGGGVQGGVEGGVPPILDDETTVSSIGTELCSWSRMIWRPALFLYAKKNNIFFHYLTFLFCLVINKNYFATFFIKRNNIITSKKQSQHVI